ERRLGMLRFEMAHDRARVGDGPPAVDQHGDLRERVRGLELLPVLHGERDPPICEPLHLQADACLCAERRVREVVEKELVAHRPSAHLSAFRSSRTSSSTVPRVPPACFDRHSPSVSKRASPTSSLHGASTRAIARASAGSVDSSRTARRTSGTTRRNARSAVPVLMLYLRPTQAFGNTPAIALK